MLRRRWRQRAGAVAGALAASSAVMLAAAAPASADQVRDKEQGVLTQMQLHAAWSVTEGRGVTVAVIDSGVHPNVSDLAGSVTTGPDLTEVSTSPDNPDWGQHGTWMAALVAGHGHGFNGQDGIIGSAPEAKVLSIRAITDKSDPGYQQYQQQAATHGQDELAEAINYAVAHKAGVISMSLGYNLQSKVVREALQNAYEHNVVVVASAGNSGDKAGAAGTGSAPYSFPADYPGVLGVAAVNSQNQVASFSSENLSVQVAAPGDSVTTEGPDDQYFYVSGTSPAAALTAGVVALIKAAHPQLTDAQVISAITSSTTPSTRPKGGWNEQIGFGVVNARLALAAAAKLTVATPPAAGVAAGSHFGGGPAAVPPVPVAPRGPEMLILWCLLAAVCLALVGLAASKLAAASADRGTAGQPAPDGPWPGFPGFAESDGVPGGAPAAPTWPPPAAAPAGARPLEAGQPLTGVHPYGGMPPGTMPPVAEPQWQQASPPAGPYGPPDSGGWRGGYPPKDTGGGRAYEHDRPAG